MTSRLGRFLAVIVVSFAVAAFLIWYGLEMLTHPAMSIPIWLGWALLAAGIVKAVLWTVYSVVFVRHRRQVARSLR
jgi:hypothetical protein